MISLICVFTSITNDLKPNISPHSFEKDQKRSRERSRERERVQEREREFKRVQESSREREREFKRERVREREREMEDFVSERTWKAMKETVMIIVSVKPMTMRIERMASLDFELVIQKRKMMRIERRKNPRIM